MRVPRRKIRDIPSQPLPSLLTLFPKPPSPLAPPQGPSSPRKIEDGIELVPIEWQTSNCAKLLIPGQEEKEVVFSPGQDGLIVKPLPNLPKSRWDRMPIKHRMLVILCLQMLSVLTVGLSLMAVKGRANPKIPGVGNQGTPTADPPQPSISPPPELLSGGTFGAVMITPQTKSSSCISQSNETGSWTCYPQYLRVQMLPPSMGDAGQPFVILKAPAALSPMRYGSREALQTGNLTLKPTTDDENPGYGWAYYFRTTYTRSVLINESRIGSESNLSESADTNEIISVGQYPWWCTFPEVTIEGYIYASRNTNKNESVLLSTNMESTEKVPVLPYAMKYTEWYSSSIAPPQCARMNMFASGGLLTMQDFRNITLSQPASSRRAAPVFHSSSRPTPVKRQLTPSTACRCQWMLE